MTEEKKNGSVSLGSKKILKALGILILVSGGLLWLYNKFGDDVADFFSDSGAGQTEKIFVFSIGLGIVLLLILFVRKEKDIRQSMGSFLTAIVSLVIGGVAGYYLFSLLEKTFGVHFDIETKVFFVALMAVGAILLFVRLMGGLSKDQQGGLTHLLVYFVILIAIIGMSSCVKKWTSEETSVGSAPKEVPYLRITSPVDGMSLPAGTPVRVVWESNVPQQQIEIQWCAKATGCAKSDWHYVLTLRNGGNGGTYTWSPPSGVTGDVSIFVGMLIPQKFRKDFNSIWALEAQTRIKIQ